MTLASLVDRKLSRLFSFAAICGVLFFSGSISILRTHAATEISDGSIKLLYTMNGDVNDHHASNGWNATTTNGTAPQFTSSTFGNLGTPFTNDTSVVTYHGLKTTTTIDMSGVVDIGAWVKFLDVTSNDRAITNTSDGRGQLVLDHITDKIYCQLTNSGSVEGSTLISAGTWYYIDCQRNGNSVTLSINNANVGTYTSANAIDTVTVCVANACDDTENMSGYVGEIYWATSTISSTTLNAIYNNGSGTVICVTVGCGTPAATSSPYIATGTLQQYRSNNSSTIAAGTSTPENTVFFDAKLISSSTNPLQLQVEVTSSSGFANTPTVTSTASVYSGNVASTSVYLSNGSYHWQARVLDTVTNATSSWVAFSTSTTDFIVATPPSVEISDGSVLGLYHFTNADLVDSSGNGRNGTECATPMIFTSTTTVAGASYAANTNGGNGCFSATSTIMNLTGDFTIGTWIRSNAAFSTSSGPYFVWKSISGSTQEGLSYSVGCVADSLEYTHNSSCNSTFNYTFTNNAWTWLLAERHGSSTDYYVNDALQKNTTDGSTENENASVFFNSYWNGLGTGQNYDYDEVFLANKAISTSTRDSLWNNHAGAEVCTKPGCGSDPTSFYAQIQNASTLYLRQNPNTSSTIIKQLPGDWTVYVSSTLSATGTTVISNGYKWFDVVDKTDGVEGWMAATSSSATYLSYVSSSQSDFQTKASTTLTTSSTRAEQIVSAVNWYWSHVSSTDSLYNTGFSSLFSATSTASSTWLYPKELFYAIASQEDGGTTFQFDNENVSFDYGHGIMQLTPGGVYADEPTSTGNWIYNSGMPTDGSHILINPCAMAATSTYVSCYTHGGEHNGSAKAYKDYGYSNVSTTYKFYTNSPQSIDANIKDGLTILSEKYKAASSTATASSTVFQPYEREWIHATWGYNGFVTSTTYLSSVASQLDTLSDYISSTGTRMVATSSFTVDLANKLRIADNNKEQVIVYSPVTVSISDSAGRQAGIVNGVVKEDIPDSAYNDRTESAVVFFPDGKEPFTYTVVGKGTGTYGLQIIHARNGIKNIVYAPAIPTKPGQVDQYSVDWNTVAQGGKGVTVKIDYEGNGVVDKTITTGADLADISLYTAAPPKDEGRPVVVAAPPPPPPPMQLPPPLQPAPPPPPPAPSSTEEIAPPVISNLTSVVASTSVTISWTTNKVATTQLLFGSSTAMVANVPADGTFTTSHSRHVSGLAPGSTYYYEVQSRDLSGKTTNSTQQSFTASGP